MGVCLRHRHEFGIAAVDVPAGGTKGGADILVRIAGRVMDPADAHTVALAKPRGADPKPIDMAHHLVPRHHGQHWGGGAPLDLVKLGVADAAGCDLQAHLARARFGNRQVCLPQRRRILHDRADPIDHHGLHGAGHAPNPWLDAARQGWNRVHRR